MLEKIEWYREVLELEPSSKLFFPLARLLTRLDRRDEAVAALRQGLERHPEFTEARLYLVELLFQDGNIAECESHLSRLTGVFTHYPGFWEAWGACLNKEGAAPDLPLAISFLAAMFQNEGLSMAKVMENGLKDFLNSKRLETAAAVEPRPVEAVVPVETVVPVEAVVVEEPIAPVETVVMEEPTAPVETVMPVETAAPFVSAPDDGADTEKAPADFMEEPVAEEIAVSDFMEEPVAEAETFATEGDFSTKAAVAAEEAPAGESLAEDAFTEEEAAVSIEESLADQAYVAVDEAFIAEEADSADFVDEPCLEAEASAAMEEEPLLILEEEPSCDEPLLVLETPSGYEPPLGEHAVDEPLLFSRDEPSVDEPLLVADSDLPVDGPSVDAPLLVADAPVEEALPVRGEQSLEELEAAVADDEADEGFIAPQAWLPAQSADEQTVADFSVSPLAAPEEALAGDMAEALETRNAPETPEDAAEYEEGMRVMSSSAHPLRLLVQNGLCDGAAHEETQDRVAEEDSADEVEEQFSLRTRSMAEVLAEQGDVPGALEIYSELLSSAGNEAERTDLQSRINTLSARLGKNYEPVYIVEDLSERQAPGKHRMITMLEALADRLEARAQS